ncbi:outer membrane protein OmpK [Vibrio sp. T20]|uniref:outer membrane protein OmpK n=1 Tax=Vibrio sp. T20 TaxID=2588450 RepID=UPI0011B6F6EA|nr:outer membrane protein OmpK [Vibrio sp. T20]
MRTILPIFIINFSASFSLPVHCEYLYGWGDISINYYDWTKDTETRSYGFKNDYGFIEIEGGANFSWGEIYGLFDMELQENVNEFGQKISGQSIGSTSKGNIAVKTGLGDLRYFSQTYSTESLGYHFRDSVFGVSYLITDSNWSFAPFIGIHHVNTEDFADFNGGMFGWVGYYNFELSDQSFSITHWFESEFSRSSEYLESNIASGTETDSLSANGAISLWWNATSNVSTGIQYYYAHNKLQQSKTDSAIIYTIKYNF